MALPKIEYPTFNVQLLSRKEPVKIRPFLVKEQKILMMAVETKELDGVIDALKQIINLCVVDDNFDVKDLPLIDIETLFLHLRARSVSENIDVYFKCKNEMEPGRECGMVIDIAVDLLNDVTIKNLISSNKIMLTDKIGVLMKYPSIKQLNMKDSDVDMVIDCIDKIFDEDNVINASEASDDEIKDFVENLSTNHYDKLMDFVASVPTIHYAKTQKCPRCSFEHNVVMEGLNDFFI